MSKKKIKYSIKGRFVALEFYLLNSPAWKALCPGECRLYIEIKRRYNTYNNGDIGLGVREAAAEIGVNKDTVSKWFRGLQRKGFIQVSTRGTFDHRKNRKATTWILTEYPLEGQVRGTKEFMNWKSPSNDYPVIDGGSVLQRTSKKNRPKKEDPQYEKEVPKRRHGPTKAYQWSEESGPKSQISELPRSRETDTYNIPGRVLRIPYGADSITSRRKSQDETSRQQPDDVVD